MPLTCPQLVDPSTSMQVTLLVSLHAVECTNSPTNPTNGAFKVCNNPTAFQDTCGGDCGSGYTGSLTATCTAPNTWTITNNCAKSKLGCTPFHRSPPPASTFVPRIHAAWHAVRLNDIPASANSSVICVCSPYMLLHCMCCCTQSNAPTAPPTLPMVHSGRAPTPPPSKTRVVAAAAVASPAA
jgi:hypothetical protein